MYLSTSIYLLLCEVGLIPTSTLLNHRQRQYDYRLLSLPDQHLAKNEPKKRDANSQIGKLPENTLI